MDSSLTQFEKSVVLASKEPRIKDLQRLEVGKKVTEVISSAFVALGSKPMNLEERKILERAIETDLYISFPNITLKEFQIAVYKGSMGDFKIKDDEVIMITPKNVHTWINAYRDFVKKDIIAKQRALEYKKEKENKPDQETIHAQMKEFIEKSIIEPYNLFKIENRYTFDDPANVVYNFLDKLGLIPFTIERKNEIYEQAKEQFRKKHKAGTTAAEVLHNMKVIKEMEAGSSKIQSELKIMAKKIALEIFLTDCKEMDMDLGEMIKEAYATRQHI